MFEYDYPKLHQWAKEASMADAQRDIERRRKKRLQRLSVVFWINMDFTEVQQFMDWLEVGLRVSSNERGYEIVRREIE